MRRLRRVGVRQWPGARFRCAAIASVAHSTGPFPRSSAAPGGPQASSPFSWDAPTGATHYDVPYSGNGANAHTAWNMPRQSETGTQNVNHVAAD